MYKDIPIKDICYGECRLSLFTHSITGKTGLLVSNAEEGAALGEFDLVELVQWLVNNTTVIADLEN